MAAGAVTVNISNPLGKALTLDGAAYVNCGKDPSLDLTENLTISAWVKFDASNVTQKISDKGGVLKLWHFNNGIAYFDLPEGTIRCFGADGIQAGVWAHMCATYERYGEGNNTRIYKDASLVAQEVNTVAMGTSAASDLKIGEAIVGKIADVRIYSRAITATEVAELHKGKETHTQGLILHLTFHDTSDLGHDASGMGNDGTLVGAGAVTTARYNTIKDDIESVRVSASDIYGFVPLANDHEIMTVHIEE